MGFGSFLSSASGASYYFVQFTVDDGGKIIEGKISVSGPTAIGGFWDFLHRETRDKLGHSKGLKVYNIKTITEEEYKAFALKP